MLFPASYYFIPFRFKYSPQHPVLKYLQSIFSSLHVKDQVSHPYKNAGKKKQAQFIYFIDFGQYLLLWEV
jgi:hypothetical protein